MRQKLNSNPIAQIALVGVLVVLGGYLFMSSTGGGEEEESASTEATVAVAGTEATSTATGATPGEAVEGAVEGAIEAAEGEAGAASASATIPSAIQAPPPPAPVTAAYRAGETVVLLIVHDGGIDDRLVARSAPQLRALDNVAVFVVPAARIARYAAITLGVEVERVPALVVMGPRKLSGGTPQASVSYGFQSPQSLVQAVRDAAYNGPAATYYPN